MLPALGYQWRDRDCTGISFSRQVAHSTLQPRLRMLISIPHQSLSLPLFGSACHLGVRHVKSLGIHLLNTPNLRWLTHYTGANMLHECMHVHNGLLGGGVSGPIHPAVPNHCIASLLFLICLTRNLSFQIINFYLFSRLHLIYAFQLLSQIILYVIGFFFPVFCFVNVECMAGWCLSFFSFP